MKNSLAHALNSKSHSELISQCFTAVTQYSNESASHKCNHAVCFGSDVICNIFRSTKFYTALFAPKKKEEKITAHNHRAVEEEDFRKFPSAWNNEPFGVLFNKKRDEKREKGVFFPFAFIASGRARIIICIHFSFCEIAF